MEKNLNSAIATLISVTFLFVYLLPYYMPYTYAIDNGSPPVPPINGSISNIPGGVKVTLIIKDLTNGQWVAIPMLSSSNNFFSQPLNVNENDSIVFRINGKDAKIIQYNSSALPIDVPYVPPGPVDVTSEPSAVPIVATPVPFKINVTSTSTPTPLPTSVLSVTAEPTATPAPISSSSTASPSPTAAPSIYPVIFAILIGIIILALLILYLRKR